MTNPIIVILLILQNLSVSRYFPMIFNAFIEVKTMWNRWLLITLIAITSWTSLPIELSLVKRTITRISYSLWIDIFIIQHRYTLSRRRFHKLSSIVAFFHWWIMSSTFQQSINALETTNFLLICSITVSIITIIKRIPWVVVKHLISRIDLDIHFSTLFLEFFFIFSVTLLLQ